MKLSVDAVSDSLILILKDSRWDATRKVAPGINLLLDETGDVVAIEIQHLMRRGVGSVPQNLSIDLGPPDDSDEEVLEIPQQVLEKLRAGMDALGVHSAKA